MWKSLRGQELFFWRQGSGILGSNTSDSNLHDPEILCTRMSGKEVTQHRGPSNPIRPSGAALSFILTGSSKTRFPSGPVRNARMIDPEEDERTRGE